MSQEIGIALHSHVIGGMQFTLVQPDDAINHWLPVLLEFAFLQVHVQRRAAWGKLVDGQDYYPFGWPTA